MALTRICFLSWTLSTQIEINRSGTRSTVHPGRQTLCIDLRSKCKHLHAIFLIKIACRCVKATLVYFFND